MRNIFDYKLMPVKLNRNLREGLFAGIKAVVVIIIIRWSNNMAFIAVVSLHLCWHLQLKKRRCWLKIILQLWLWILENYIWQSCREILDVLVDVAVVLQEPLGRNGGRLVVALNTLSLRFELETEIFVDHGTENIRGQFSLDLYIELQIWIPKLY